MDIISLIVGGVGGLAVGVVIVYFSLNKANKSKQKSILKSANE